MNGSLSILEQHLKKQAFIVGKTAEGKPGESDVLSPRGDSEMDCSHPLELLLLRLDHCRLVHASPSSRRFWVLNPPISTFSG